MAETEPCQRKLSPPLAAVVLGVLGLVPFVGGAAVYAYGPGNLAGPALLTLLAWSAATLSFLGGARWGVEMAMRREPRWRTLAASTLPPLAAWLLLAAAPFAAPERQLAGFIAAFVAQWLWDALSKSPPRWWPRLRTLLTLGAVLSLAVALEATLSL